MINRKTARFYREVCLYSAVFFLAGCLTAPEAAASGTSAGTIIGSRATAVYSQNGSSHSLQSSLNAIIVDDRVSFIITATDAANVTITPGGRAFRAYRLINSGNAPHDFTLKADVAGVPTLIPVSGPYFYADTAGTNLLPIEANAGGLPYISNLGPDSARTFFIQITAPVSLTDEQTCFYLITAEAYQPATLGLANPPQLSSAQAAIDALAEKNAHPLTPYAILADGHGSGGDADRDGRYSLLTKDGTNNMVGFKAVSSAVTIVKTATVTDRFGGSQPLSGATISYALVVQAAGSGSALGVVITDRIPADTTYTSGTLRLNDSTLSDQADSDSGDVGGTTSGVVTVRLGEMYSITPVQTIRFDVTIN